ncbi:MAG TPA: 3-methyl-2-indolic acid synthase [Amycolatopsis sp.]|uniref:3-methyl-2-indolic acid synthase n=1 Tax=Amycolatopsis sp. TaxID=37632 RepID=UPI002B4A5D35|nr:3-methyl-2-indolic acid synthase [Amycolatopsis sp.]HKS46439.1 3-methyl-2-indolic acid synthase [Amycolatopsis sp.]
MRTDLLDIEVNRFRLPEPASISAEVASARARDLLDLPPDQEPPISRAALAAALWRDRSVTNEELVAAAERRLATRRPQINAFVPLYTTNHCDSECKMCGMRKGNPRLIRKYAGKKELEEQLEILYYHEYVRGVIFLTGEYQDKYARLSTAFRIGWAIRQALDMGFQRVHSNIGSMESDEIEVLGEWVGRDEPVGIAVFQETYDHDSYRRFMGEESSDVPKADYARRLSTFDRWIDNGFRHLNAGVLVGLHDNVESELVRLIAHVTHLRRRGAIVDVSLPRMRPASSAHNNTWLDDDEYLRMMAAFAYSCPDQRLVLSSRENEQFQDRSVGLCGVVSPGSPDVAPYQRDGAPLNDEESSQFIAGDLRRPRETLLRVRDGGRDMGFFEYPKENPLVAEVGS